MSRLTHRWFFLGVVLYFVGLSIVKYKPLWVEQYYEGFLYPPISYLNQWLWARFPFSVGDIGYCIAILFGLWSLRKFSLRRHFWKALSIIALVVVLFYTSWGLHYFKVPMREQRQLPYTLSVEQLNQATTHYAEKLTELHNKLTTAPEKKVSIDASTQNILALATETMKASAFRPQRIDGKAKATLFPTVLSYMGFGGYANPFTHEAQVNTLQPKLKIITTACHEIAHQWGYAAEDEANFISIKASTASENVLVAYAGNMLAFQYLSNALYRYDINMAKEQYQSVPKGVIAHFQEVRAFWQQYKNPFEPLFKKSYDQFLKTNHQQEGIKSYSLVVGLLVDDVTPE
mgnify:CR=1 FL=1